jgi:hypothetical protein
MGMFGDAFGAIGGLVGSLASQSDYNDAAEDLANATKQYQDLSSGKITPQTEQTFTQGPSAYLSADPATRAAQMSALQNYQSTYAQGGLDATTRSNLNNIQNQSNQQARAQQAGIMQDAARRGIASSGNSLVSQQVAAQQAAQQGSQQAMQAAALAQQNRNAALAGATGLAGQIRTGDYQNAAAQDAISRFNAQNSQTVANNNVNRDMQGQQQSWTNAFNRAGGIAGGYRAQAGQSNTQAGVTQGRWAGIGQGLGSSADAAGDQGNLMSYFGGGGGGGSGGAGGGGGGGSSSGGSGSGGIDPSLFAGAIAGLA